jgi:hypothetical protein
MRVNQERSTLQGEKKGRLMEIISVSMSVEQACSDLTGALRRLAVELGPGRADRVVCLPPLLASLSGLDPGLVAKDLDLAVTKALEGRMRRRLGVWFAYPRLSRQRRRWLVLHDRVHETLRGPIATFARDLKCVVLGGTAVLDHPRTHWEAWPHTGALFHTAWSFGPDGEPHDVLRDGEPSWEVLAAAKLDSSRAGAGPHLNTPLGAVSVDWGRGAGDGGIFEWRPRAEASPPATPVARSRPMVQSSLVGSLQGELLDDTVILIPGFTPREARPRGDALQDGLAWCAAQLGPQL